MQSDINSLLKLLNIKFKDTEILSRAFYHRSYLNEVRDINESNERLEFLGDSVLSLIVSSNLFNRRVADSEGELTNLRAYIVKTKSLAEAAKKLNLGSFLSLSKGEELGGGRENPQLLANTYEALLGAIFLDQGLTEAEKFVDNTLLSLFESELKSGPPKDAKSTLQEAVQEKFKESPHYKIIGTKGPDHAKEFRVAVYINNKNFGEGVGPSKQEAEEHSAKEALKKLVQ